MGLTSPICFPSDWTNLEEQQNSTMQGEAKGESPPSGIPSMPTMHHLTLECCHHSFHEVPTCSTCNQEDEAQMRGHLVILQT